MGEDDAGVIEIRSQTEAWNEIQGLKWVISLNFSHFSHFSSLQSLQLNCHSHKMNVKAERRVFIEIAAEARSVEPFISPAIT